VGVKRPLFPFFPGRCPHFLLFCLKDESLMRWGSLSLIVNNNKKEKKKKKKKQLKIKN
jgi:hypothetical protein